MNFKILGLLISSFFISSLNAMRTQEIIPTQASHKSLLEERSEELLKEFGDLPGELKSAFLYECFRGNSLTQKQADEIMSISPTLLYYEEGKYCGIPLDAHIIFKTFFKVKKDKKTTSWVFSPCLTRTKK